ncbi:hypothetical protein [Scale drop disease virus]|uniref:ORF_004L n=1 Tax=Scale drop disease virus TaxID=1697349 RepID=A0A0K1L6D2_9VIRU|nr:ORF_004L [Scale drop disease virus]AKU37419.1 ORF_004L [Scale drop disease virus]QLI60674.1 hypothetical protein [Scale drop disease virus]QXJ13592.1 ORF004L [Scale drop disease virus]UNH60781.1 hypothetical protein SDDV_ORF112 [Scale drop disease virus]
MVDIADVLNDIDFNETLTPTPINPPLDVLENDIYFSSKLLVDNKYGPLYSNGRLTVVGTVPCNETLTQFHSDPIIDAMLKIYTDNVNRLTNRLDYFVSSHMHNIVNDIKQGSIANDIDAWTAFVTMRSNYNQGIRNKLMALLPSLVKTYKDKYDTRNDRGDTLMQTLKSHKDDLQTFADRLLQQELSDLETRLSEIHQNSRINFQDVDGYINSVANEFAMGFDEATTDIKLHLSGSTDPIIESLSDHVTTSAGNETEENNVLAKSKKVRNIHTLKIKALDDNIAYIDNKIKESRKILHVANNTQINNNNCITSRDVYNQFDKAVAAYPRQNLIDNPDRMKLNLHVIPVQTYPNQPITTIVPFKEIEVLLTDLDKVIIGQGLRVIARVNLTLTDLPDGTNAWIMLCMYCNDNLIAASPKYVYNKNNVAKRLCLIDGIHVVNAADTQQLQCSVEVVVGCDNVTNDFSFSLNIKDNSEMVIFAM